MADELRTALASIKTLEGSEGELWQPALEVISADGVSVSTVADFLGAETVASSDPTATRIDELQFDLGVGPCWDAVRSRRPIEAADLRQFGASRWPVFTDAATAEGVGALFAFPLVVGSLALGAMDYYTLRPGEMSPEDSHNAVHVAQAVAKVVLSRAIRRSNNPDVNDPSPFSRRLVHQATGFVVAQMEVSAEDARLLIHAHAFSTDKPVMEIARDIVERRLDFSDPRAGLAGSHD